MALITKVDNQKVIDKAQFIEILKAKEGGVLLQGFYEKGREVYYGFGM